MGLPWKLHVAVSAQVVWGELHLLLLFVFTRLWAAPVNSDSQMCVIYKLLWAYLREKGPHPHKKICASRIAPVSGSSLQGSTLDQPETSLVELSNRCNNGSTSGTRLVTFVGWSWQFGAVATMRIGQEGGSWAGSNGLAALQSWWTCLQGVQRDAQCIWGQQARRMGESRAGQYL